MKPEQAAALRAPFPPEKIGKLPKGGITLDYVGHAEVTDRLLAVDPEWTWQPMATDQYGLPMLDAAGGLWITLTICGVTRPGYGEASGGFSPGDKIKSAIGDAIRNAAMRFGVALDLWSKDDHVPADQAQQIKSKVGYMNDERPASEKQIGAVKKMMSAVPNELRQRTLWHLVGVDKYEDLKNGHIQTIFDGGKEAIGQAEDRAAQEALSGGIGAKPVEDDPWAVEKW